MKTLFAKLKGGKKERRLIFRDQQIPEYDFFPTPDVSEATEYAPLQTDLDKDMWVYVELDQEQIEQMIDPYVEGAVQDVPVVSIEEYSAINTLYLETGSKIVFSRITSGSIIHENGKQLLTMGESGPKMSRASFAVDFGGKADALYDTVSKRVYFTSFSKVAPLFKGFDIFHREQTAEEKERFFESDLFDLGNYDPEYISLADVRKIAAIMENEAIDLHDDETKSRIKAYATAYPSAGVAISNEGRIMIGGNKDLRSTLKLLEQKFYTSEITLEKFEASTTKKMAR